MLRKLIKNKKAQNTAEYAILISLVVAGIIAMQTYAQRALQSRVRGAVKYLENETGDDLGTTMQYEPYYLKTEYTVTRNEDDTVQLSNETKGWEQDKLENRKRASNGYQESTYNVDDDSNW